MANTSTEIKDVDKKQCGCQDATKTTSCGCHKKTWIWVGVAVAVVAIGVFAYHKGWLQQGYTYIKSKLS